MSKLFLVTLVVWPIGLACQGRLGEFKEIKVRSARPILNIIDDLRRRHGLVVSYEDPAYHVDYDPHSKSVLSNLVPGNIRFGYTDSELGNPGGLLTRLARLAPSAGGSADDFRVFRFHETWVVAAQRFKDSKSGWVEAVTVLDSKITIQKQEGTGLDLLRSLMKAVSNSTGVESRVGLVPVNFLASQRATLKAQNENARVVLWALLRDLGLSPSGDRKGFGWTLLCDPGIGWCALNIY